MSDLHTAARGMADAIAGPGRMRHSITARIRRHENGDTWLGVGVCLHCEPADESRRKTFSVGEPCPQCGAPGSLEWRYWPQP